MKLLSNFITVARAVRQGGGDVSFEWPKGSLGWTQPQTRALIEEFDLAEAICDGCAFGMADAQGHPVLKPWRIVSTSTRLTDALSGWRCQHERGFNHSHLEGGHITPSSGLYPEALCRTALSALFPGTTDRAPAMPVVPIDPCPFYSAESGHVGKEERVDKVLPSCDPVGLVFETDPNSPSYQGEVPSTGDFWDYDLEIDPGQDAQVLAAVTRLLSRSEVASNPAAKKAVQAEADGLLEKGTWDLSTVTEKENLVKQARKSGIKIHLGQLMMSICSEKFAELAEHLRVLKGRIVFQMTLLKTRKAPPQSSRIWPLIQLA